MTVAAKQSVWHDLLSFVSSLQQTNKTHDSVPNTPFTLASKTSLN